MLRIGIDEVGRGCWAGPLVAGAVLLDTPIAGLKDSKLLSRKRREELSEIVKKSAVSYGLGWVSPEDIDTSGITTAVKRAMTEALKELRRRYEERFHVSLDGVEIIVDGHIQYLDTEPDARALIKADLTQPAVSAASIIAKVARDQYMYKMADQFPMYGFETHVGYGTATHIAALEKYGVCYLHRKSYKPIQKLLRAA